MAEVRLTNVTKRFGGLVAVDDVSLEIKRGEIMAIVGPNGAGKTTLFNLINGVFPCDEGRIIFEDVDVTNLPAFRRAHLGIGRTFQIARPFASASVQENIAIGAMFGAQGVEIGVERAMEMADHYIELIGLQDHRDKRAGGLTPIEKKLVEIARALAMKPRLLLMDEAMAGMTPREIDQTLHRPRLLFNGQLYDSSILPAESSRSATAPTRSTRTWPSGAACRRVRWTAVLVWAGSRSTPTPQAATQKI